MMYSKRLSKFFAGFTLSMMVVTTPGFALAAEEVIVEIQEAVDPVIVSTDDGASPVVESSTNSDGASEVVSDTTAPEITPTGDGATEDVLEDVLEETVTDPIVESSANSDGANETPASEEEVVVQEETVVTEEVVVEDSSPAPPVSESTVVSTPTLTTDKDDYHPGETATIFGKLFSPLQNIILKIFGSDDNDQNYTEEVQNLTTNGSGLFTTTYKLDDLYRPFYRVVASTLEGELLAETYFRDAAIGKYDQCSNDDGDGYATGDTECRFINGNLQSNNSTYFEGDSTIQRLWMEGYAPGSPHTITLKYGTTKAAKHAYDFLTTWDWSEDWSSLADRCDGIAGCLTASETTLDIPQDPNVPDSFEPSAPGDRQFVMRGGTLVSATTPALVSGVYGSGDSETAITISFNAAPNGDMCSTKQGITSCGVVLWFGAHVAQGLDWVSVDGQLGATGISGSPYHVSLDAIDGASVGERDNQMQSGAIRPSGTITIIKDAVPNDAQDFSFTVSGTGLSNFSLDDDADNTLPNTQVFTGLVDGSYTITEGVTSGWTLTNLVCVDPTTNSNVNLGTRTASINLAAGESVTCTYTNTKNPTLIVKKVMVGDTGTFNFTGTPNGSISTNNGTIQTTVTPGQYVSTESVPAGWVLTDVTCDDANSVGNAGNATATFNAEAGETITCTFTNTKQGKIIVEKQTLPNGSTQNFEFDTSYDVGNVFLQDGQTYISGFMAPGTYSVAEVNIPSGWNLTSSSCSDGSPINAIDLAAGETVTCTFNNTQDGSITVVKNTVGGNGTFNFTSNFGVSQLTTVGGTDSETVNNLNPGTYNVSETVPAGWDLTSATCSDGSDPSSIGLSAGESVTCTFTNTKKPTLTVIKDLIPSNDPGLFNLRIDGVTHAANVGDAGTTGAQYVSIGAHTVSETAGTNTTLSDYTSVIGGDCLVDGSVSLAAGDDKTCTITNTRNTGTIELKKIWSGTGGQTTLNIGTTAGDDDVDTQLTGAAGGAPLTTGQNPVNTGTYYLSETGGLVGYTTSALVCYNDANNNGTNDGESSVTVGANDSVEVAKDQHVICSYTNTRDTGTVIVKKVMIGGTSTFDFTGTPNGSIAVNNGTIQSVVDTGSYQSTETAEAGWDLTSISCDDANSTGNVGTATATFNVEKGETVTCTFTNTKRGEIIVEKQTLPDGSSATFDFTGDAAGTISDGGTIMVSNLIPGAYTSVESAKTGWDLTSIVCDDANSTGTVGTRTASFNVEAGETVKCTFTNTQRAHIIIVKDAIPDNSQSFTFNNDFGNGNPTSFNLVDDSTPGLPQYDAEVLPGEYEVSETPVVGWQLDSATCDMGETIDDIDVAPGETVTCTFTNEKLAKLTLVKNTIGGDATFDFVMTGDTLAPSAQLTTVAGTDSEVFENLNPDNEYSITETPIPAGWAKTNAVCTGTNTPESITPNAGEEITCTFTNNKPAAQIDLDPLDANNQVGDDHVITVMVQVHNGDGTWGPAADGTTVTFSLVNNTANASFVGGDNDCTTTAGSCSVTINSTTPGGVDIHASATPVVLGVNLPVQTGVGADNSADAHKDYVNARISIAQSATNAVNDDHPFTITVEQSTANGVWTPVENALVDVVVSPAPDSLVETDCNDGTAANGTCVATVNSSVTGQFTARARTTITVDGVEFKLQTNGVGENSDPAVKTYVNAHISITPDATNEVGDNHTFTVNVRKDLGDGAGFVPAAGEAVVVTLANSNGAVANPAGPINGVTDGAGQFDVTFTSATAGVVTGHAIASITVGGVVFNLATDGAGINSDDAVKTFVDANIQINPPTATNRIGDTHTFTAHVNVNDGSGAGFVNAPDGTVINFTIDFGPGAFTTVNPCVTAGGTGSCSIDLVSNVTGTTQVTADTTVTVGGLPLDRETDGSGANSAPARKGWVNARISITPLTDVNEVNDDHEFIVTVEAKTDEISGFLPVPNAIVNAIVSPATTIDVSDCNAGTDVNGQCTVIVNSSTVGTFTVTARSTINVGPVEFKLQTNGQGDNSSPGVKKYVDAKIEINPESATNNIRDAHIFTVTVTQYPGTATPAATANVTTNVTPTPDITNTTTCGPAVLFVGNVATCTITINNSTPNVFEATASATMTVGGVALARSTNGLGGNSGPAEKTYVAGALDITKVVELGQVVNPAGIDDTFTVTVTGPSYPVGHNVVFTLVDGVLQAPTTVSLAPLIPGNYTVVEADAGDEWTEVVATSPVAVVANATSTVTVTNTYVPGSLDVTKSVVTTGYLFANDYDQTFTMTVTGPSYPAGTQVIFNVVNGVLSPATQNLANLIPGSYDITEADPGVMWTVTGNGVDVNVPAGGTGSGTITNTIKLPNTNISLTANTYEATATENVTLTITDTNTGEVPITNPSVELYANNVLTIPQPTFVSESGVANGIMDVGETWTWTWTGQISANTVFTVNGTGLDPLGNPVNGPTYVDETESITVRLIGTTRTIGFWQTHTTFTSSVFNSFFAGGMQIGSGSHKGLITNTQLAGQSQVFGAFYAPIAKTTAGAKRSPVDQARIQMLQQLVAAKLNCAAFGCSAATMTLIADADAAYAAGTNKNLIISLAGQLDAFNNSGDAGAIPPALGATGKATPKTSQSWANTAFWNQP